MGCNGGKGERKGQVGIETEKLELGGSSGVGDRRLGVGQEGEELLLHGGHKLASGMEADQEKQGPGGWGEGGGEIDG